MQAMNDHIQTTIETLKELRLPELRARYAEVFGEESRCPNKTWLARKIAEAEAQEATSDEEAPAETQADAPDAPPTDEEEDQPQPEPDDEVAEDAEPETTGEGDQVKLSKLSVEELRQRYREVIQRDTSSTSRPYLLWKLRQAEKGRIPIGPRRTRRADGDAQAFKVLPLRMEADLVTQLDEARERLGFKSRMELFRRSLHAFLLEAGEVRVAEMFAPEA
jgi:hypothetical protein